MNDYIDVAVFCEEKKNKNGRKMIKPLYIQKYKLTAGQRKITLNVKGKPFKAGIDPCNKLIDCIPDNNMSDIDIE